MKKRVLALALSIVAIVSVSACGSELKPNDESDKENTFAEDTVNEEKTIEGLCEAIHKTETEDKVITDFTHSPEVPVLCILRTYKKKMVQHQLVHF